MGNRCPCVGMATKKASTGPEAELTATPADKTIIDVPADAGKNEKGEEIVSILKVSESFICLSP